MKTKRKNTTSQSGPIRLRRRHLLKKHSGSKHPKVKAPAPKTRPTRAKKATEKAPAQNPSEAKQPTVEAPAPKTRPSRTKKATEKEPAQNPSEAEQPTVKAPAPKTRPPRAKQAPEKAPAPAKKASHTAKAAHQKTKEPVPPEAPFRQVQPKAPPRKRPPGAKASGKFVDGALQPDRNFPKELTTCPSFAHRPDTTNGAQMPSPFGGVPILYIGRWGIHTRVNFPSWKRPYLKIQCFSSQPYIPAEASVEKHRRFLRMWLSFCFLFNQAHPRPGESFSSKDITPVPREEEEENESAREEKTPPHAPPKGEKDSPWETPGKFLSARSIIKFNE